MLKKHFSILLVLLIFSCRKKTVPDQSPLLGLDYYPVESGKFVIYDVDSTIYTEIPRDTIVYKYQVKEKIADSFTDNQGRTAWRLERYIRMADVQKPFDSIPWTMKEVWLMNADNRSVQVVENNYRFTKLTFPVSEGSAWDGNQHNTLGKQNYNYDYVDRSEKIGASELSKVLKVEQEDFRTLISLEQAWEKYAKGVGLVSREIIELYSNSIVPNKAVEFRIEHGFHYKQTLSAYGKE
jgi:hypothetical protein